MHHIARLVSGHEPVPGVRFEILDREREATILDVDTRDHRFDLLSFLQYFAGVFDSARPGDVRHVHETINTVFDFDERPKVGEIADATLDSRTNLIALMQSAPRVVLNLLHAQADTASLGIDRQYFHFDGITGVN